MELVSRYAIDGKNISCRFMDDEVVVLNLDSGHYYGLNDVGTLIWKEIEKKSSLEEILNTIEDEYDVSPDVAKSDLMDLVVKLEKEELIMKI